MTETKRRFSATAMAVGLPLVLLGIVFVRLAESPEPERAPERSRLRSSERPSPSRSPAPGDVVSVTPETRPVSETAPREQAPAPPPAGSPFQAPRHHRAGHYETWDLSLEELSWIVQHAEEIFGTALAAEPGGGVRLSSLSAGAYAADRGFQPDDVIVNINGSPVYEPADLAGLLRSSARTGSRGWRFAIDRNGKSLTFDLRNLIGP